MSTTLEICPASLGEPSTLNTSMGRETFQMLIPFARTKSLSMKLPVAPESKSALTECTLLVSVVLISIGRMIDVLRASRMLAKSRLDSLFSHFGLRDRAFLSGVKERSASIGLWIFVLTSSTFNTANLFTNSDRGVLFAGHTKQNPPPGWSLLPLPLLHPSKPLNLRSILPIAPWLASRHSSGRGSPLQDS